MESSLELCSVLERIELSLFLLQQALVPNDVIQQKLLRKPFWIRLVPFFRNEADTLLKDQLPNRCSTRYILV